MFLLVLIFVLNVCGLLVYRASHPNQAPSLELWNYLESDTFKLITGSLALPLLVFLVEGRFNIAETISKNQEERAQKAQDERRQWRLEAIEQSRQTWADLYALATEVVYWQPEHDLPDLRARSTNFVNRAEEMFASWPICFPSIYEVVNLEGVILPLLNTLNNCINSVAVYLGETDDREERADLQATLGVIQDGVKIVGHYQILGILRSGVELETLRDSRRRGGTLEGDSKAEESKLFTDIRGFAANLGGSVKAIVEREAGAETMPNLDGVEAGAFREVYRTARDWLLVQPERTLTEYKDYETFRERFEAIPHPQLMRAYQISYTKQWLRELSDWFALTSYSLELEARTRPPTWCSES